ncbi:hypothetical protein L9F63_019131, partial [Diploptera punctata]
SFLSMSKLQYILIKQCFIENMIKLKWFHNSCAMQYTFGSSLFLLLLQILYLITLIYFNIIIIFDHQTMRDEYDINTILNLVNRFNTTAMKLLKLKPDRLA